MKHLYTIERWTLGWIIKSDQGFSISDLLELAKLLPKDLFLDSGIARHYQLIGIGGTVLVAVKNDDAVKWCDLITKKLQTLPSEQRWWLGVDVGLSSAVIFGVLASDKGLCYNALDYGDGSTPRDADDFGRCKRLLDLFPEWRDRLSEVAFEYPETLWPQIVARWNEIENSDANTQYKILSSLISPVVDSLSDGATGAHSCPSTAGDSNL